MKEIIEKISEVYNSFQKDAEAQMGNGNKAAGTRARKSSLELEKLLKELEKSVWKVLKIKLPNTNKGARKRTPLFYCKK